ncbi:MAG: VTT domain-containing protein [Acidobacteriaceae bacterium]|nr:VTT domain-containing protein [Acidobacteriaceae bacterium]
MNWAMQLFMHHAYAVLFGWVLVEQAGLPIPSVPILLAAGTMSSAHRLHIAIVIPLIVLASFLSDSLWYWLGKHYGSRVLELLCRFSFEASTCVSKTQGTVVKRGAVTLLFAKFVPGLSTVAAPIAGQARIPFAVFTLYDTVGTLLWAGAWLFAGRFFGDLVRRSHEIFSQLAHDGGPMVLLTVLAVVLYRFIKRRRFLHELRGLRLEPGQLMAMMGDADREGEEKPFIVDLRHPLDVLSNPEVVPGALRIAPDDLLRSRALIPRERDIVLYCTCPSEETSAKIALELRRLGIKRVRPLRGGLQGWKDAGYPLDLV